MLSMYVQSIQRTQQVQPNYTLFSFHLIFWAESKINNGSTKNNNVMCGLLRCIYYKYLLFFACLIHYLSNINTF